MDASCGEAVEWCLKATLLEAHCGIARNRDAVGEAVGELPLSTCHINRGNSQVFDDRFETWVPRGRRIGWPSKNRLFFFAPPKSAILMGFPWNKPSILGGNGVNTPIFGENHPIMRVLSKHWSSPVEVLRVRLRVPTVNQGLGGPENRINLEPQGQPFINGWLSIGWWTQSLHRKWLFHQTSSIYKWLFGVPGTSGKLLVWGPVVWDLNRGTPKNPNTFRKGIPGIQTNNLPLADISCIWNNITMYTLIWPKYNISPT